MIQQDQTRRRFVPIAVFLAVALVGMACSSETTVDGPTIVVNAMVYTVDSEQPWAESFAFDQDGQILAVGNEADVRSIVSSIVTRNEAGENASTLDAQGQLVLPGFQDAHVHVPEAGINIDVCFMPDGLTLGEYGELATECGENQPDSEWVRAAGASLFDLRDTAELPIDVLDRAVPDRPVIILDNLGHAVWTNSLGLEAAGIAAESQDPQGGVFHRASDGRLTGLILEDAQQLVRNASAPDDETNYRGLLVALETLAENGVTTISDAGGYWGQNHRAAWERAEAEGTLTVRAMNGMYVYPDLDTEEQLAVFEEGLRDNPESLLQFDTAKIYVDGILDLGTASLLEPYDQPLDANYPMGFSYFGTEQLQTYVNRLHQIGYRVNFHAIGDRAVRQALDATENIPDSPEAIAERRHRSTHTYLVHPDDIGRFGEIGLVADLQQSADAIDPDYHEYLSEFIGDRAFDLIPSKPLLAADATVILSSDWDAGPLPPLGTLERSLTRDQNGVPDLETAVAMMTIEAAYALGHDDRTGSLTVGKQADFVILDTNLFDVDYDAIDEAQVVLTVMDGTIVYEAR